MIFQQLIKQLQSLSNLLLSLTDEQYKTKVVHLGNSSIGGHIRHVIELLYCAVDGYKTGRVDYVNRSRNIQLETDRMFAWSAVLKLDGILSAPDKQLTLVTEQIEGANESINVITTYYREVVYNTEHAIHHLALIKVALIEMNLNIVGADFGMAYSTIKYNTSLAKAQE